MSIEQFVKKYGFKSVSLMLNELGRNESEGRRDIIMNMAIDLESALKGVGEPE